MPTELTGGGGERSLRKFLQELVWRHFFEDVRLEEPRLATYVTALLADFARVENLYRIRNALGKRLEDVGEMLIESNPLLDAPSFDRERQVRKHVGDYTLFMTGMFPESINHLRLRRHRLESFIDWMKAGKESYYIVSKFDAFEYTKVAPLFERLSANFEQCVYGLNCVKNELQEMQHPIVQRTTELLM